MCVCVCVKQAGAKSTGIYIHLRLSTYAGVTDHIVLPHSLPILPGADRAEISNTPPNTQCPPVPPKV